MTITVSPPTAPPTAAEVACLPSVAEVIAGVRAGRVEPADAHPQTSAWTPVVFATAGLTAVTSLFVCWAFWSGRDDAGSWGLVFAFTFAAVFGRARFEEWTSGPARTTP